MPVHRTFASVKGSSCVRCKYEVIVPSILLGWKAACSVARCWSSTHAFPVGSKSVCHRVAFLYLTFSLQTLFQKQHRYQQRFLYFKAAWGPPCPAKDTTAANDIRNKRGAGVVYCAHQARRTASPVWESRHFFSLSFIFCADPYFRVP